MANLAWLQSSMREPWQLQYFKSVFLEMSIVTLWSVFPNSVTFGYAPITNMCAWICTALVHLIIGCAIRYPKTGNLHYVTYLLDGYIPLMHTVSSTSIIE